MLNNFVFLDTCSLYALIDRDDIEHIKTVALLKLYNKSIITSNYIIDELITLLRARKICIDLFESFIEKLITGNICKVLRIKAEDEIEAWEYMKKHHDQSYSFTDCTSFVLMKQYEIHQVMTFDKHFYTAGFEIIC